MQTATRIKMKQFKWTNKTIQNIFQNCNKFINIKAAMLLALINNNHWKASNATCKFRHNVIDPPCDKIQVPIFEYKMHPILTEIFA